MYFQLPSIYITPLSKSTLAPFYSYVSGYFTTTLIFSAIISLSISLNPQTKLLTNTLKLSSPRFILALPATHLFFFFFTLKKSFPTYFIKISCFSLTICFTWCYTASITMHSPAKFLGENLSNLWMTTIFNVNPFRFLSPKG